MARTHPGLARSENWESQLRGVERWEEAKAWVNAGDHFGGLSGLSAPLLPKAAKQIRSSA